MYQNVKLFLEGMLQYIYLTASTIFQLVPIGSSYIHVIFQKQCSNIYFGKTIVTFEFE